MSGAVAQIKRCAKCDADGPFGTDRSSVDGLTAWCMPCRRESQRLSRRANPDSEKAYRAKYVASGRHAVVNEAWRARNRKLLNERSKAWQAANPEKRQSYRLKSRYGITLDDFKRLLASQNGLCAVCCEALDGGRNTHVDHDHKDGRVRGILCSGCNAGLGCLRDDQAILSRAIGYLNKHKALTGRA